MIRMLQRHLILTWKSIFSSYSRCCWLISRALLGLASWYAAAAMIHDTVRTRSTSAPRHLYRFLLFLTLIKSISKPISVILSILDISARNKLCPSYPKKHIKNFCWTFFSVFFSPSKFSHRYCKWKDGWFAPKHVNASSAKAGSAEPCDVTKTDVVTLWGPNQFIIWRSGDLIFWVGLRTFNSAPLNQHGNICIFEFFLIQYRKSCQMCQPCQKIKWANIDQLPFDHLCSNASTHIPLSSTWSLAGRTKFPWVLSCLQWPWQ